MRAGKRARDVFDLQLSQSAQRAAALTNTAPDRTHAAARFLIVLSDGLQSRPPSSVARPLHTAAAPSAPVPRKLRRKGGDSKIFPNSRRNWVRQGKIPASESRKIWGVAPRRPARQISAMAKSSSDPPNRPLRVVRKRKSGPRPKPTSLLKIQGTFRPVRHASRDPEVEAPGELAAKVPPEWMTATQREFWTETLLDAPKDILRRIDWAQFAGYVEVWDRYVRLVQAQQRLDKGLALPFLVKGASGAPALSPYLRQMNQCLILLARYAGELGFSPAARAALGRPADDRDDAANDEWTALRKPRLVHDRDKE